MKQIWFITGSSRGLGRAFTEAALAAGHQVAATARKITDLDPLKEKYGKQVLPLALDVTDEIQAKNAIEATIRTFGRLDVLVSNAGVWKESDTSSRSSVPKPTSAVSPEILRETFETNFFATVALTQKLLPLIRKAPAGRIVNVSSILGSLTLHADPASPIYASKVFAYDASKTALNAFTVHLAHELRDTQIKVNSAHPGWVKTEMGGPNATMEVSEGGKTSAQLATLADDGPNGGFFHLGQPLPW